MKKALLLVSILFISVVTTACINNLAVQELNNKAAAFMEQGNYNEAIERLKSSIDLDASLYESHYNLAIAYTKAEDYPNAISAYEKTIELKPDFADAYYGVAVVQEDLIADLNTGMLQVNDNGEVEKVTQHENADIDDEKPFVVSEKSKQYIASLTDAAIKNYELYLQKNPAASDADDVQNHVKDLKLRLNSSAKPSAEIQE